MNNLMFFLFLLFFPTLLIMWSLIVTYISQIGDDDDTDEKK